MIDIHKAFLTIGAIEWQKVVNFYQDFLSISPTVYRENYYVEFEISGLVLGIFKPKSSHESEFSQSLKSGFSLCLEVEDLQEAIQRLKKLGYKPVDEILQTSHGQEIYIYDPANNRLILHQSSVVVSKTSEQLKEDKQKLRPIS